MGNKNNPNLGGAGVTDIADVLNQPKAKSKPKIEKSAPGYKPDDARPKAVGDGFYK